LKLLDAELQRVCEEPVDEDDLVRLKSRAELGFLMAMETASGKAEQLGLYEVVLGDGSQLLSRLQEYRDITAEDVQRVARRVLDPDARVRIHVLPDDTAEGGAA
jgi:zinc protease